MPRSIRTRSVRALIVWAGIVVAGGHCAPASGQAGAIEAIVLSNHIDPARRLTVNLNGTESAVSISAEGAVAFRASRGLDDGYWIFDETGLRPLLIRGSPVPGAGGSSFGLGQFGGPVAINEQGQALVTAGIFEPGAGQSGSGWWLASEHNLQSLVQLVGQPAPGTPEGEVIAGGRARSLLSGQQAALRVSLAGPGIAFGRDEAIYAGTAGSFQLVARLGDTLPGAPSGMPAVSFGSGRGSAIAEDGTTAFWASHADPMDPSIQTKGVWVRRAGVLRPLLVQGQPAPAPGGLPATAPMGYSMNRRGEVAVSGGSGRTAYVWVDDGAGTRAVLTVPFNPAANPYPFGAPRAPMLNDRGDLFFLAPLLPSGTTAFWATRDTSVREMLRVGQVVSGPAGSATFGLSVMGDTTEGLSTVRWCTNALGQAVFAEGTDSADWTDATSQIVGWDPALGATLIARVGGPLIVAPGDVRIVGQLRVVWGSTGGDGRPTALSDTGLVAFAAMFTDGTRGVFTGAVPAPSAAALFAVAGLLALRRRRGI